MMKISIRCSFLAILCAFVPLFCFGQLPTTWQTYVAPGEQFSVRFPKDPVEFSIPRPFTPPEKPRYGRLFRVYTDGTAYLIISLENSDHRDTLDQVIAEFPHLSVFHVGFEFDRGNSLGKLKGKRYRVSSGDITGLVQFIEAGTHTYILEVVADKLANPMTNEFLRSLTLRAIPKRKAIKRDAPSLEIESVHEPSTPLTSNSNDSWSNEVAYSVKNVDRKAVIVTRPEPQYTEAARKAQVTGTVILKGILSSSGKVTNVYTLAQLPYGLTERAIAASKLMTFLPALKDGKRVSQIIQIEYNFNLY